MERSPVSVDTRKRRRKPGTYMVAFPLEFPFCFVPVRWSGQVRCGGAFPSLCILRWPRGSLLKFVSRLVESFHCARAMSFSEEEVLGALGNIPSDGFLAESAEVQAKWLHFRGVRGCGPEESARCDVLCHCRADIG